MPTAADDVVNVDPLVSLGLIDPKLIDAEPGSNPNATSAGDPQDGEPETKAKEPEEITQLKAKVTELEGRLNAPAPPVSTIGGRNYEEDIQRLDRFAEQALNDALHHPNVAQNDEELKAGKTNPATVRALVQAEHGRLVAEARSYWDRIVLAPAAAMASAQKIAKEMSTNTVKIDPQDLLDPTNYPDGKPSVDGMRTRAHMMLNSKRDENFAARTKKGADRVEGGAAPGQVSAEAIDKLDSFHKIKLGLLRSAK